MKDERTINRSLTIAATASLAGAACLAFGLFLAVGTDSRAGEEVGVWTSGDDDVVKRVQVIAIGKDAEAMAEAELAEAEEGTGGYLGVDVREDTKSTEGGAYVNHVVADSPAAKGGLKDGDVIVGFGGEVVRGPGKLTQKIRETKPGDKVALDVRRDGRVQKLSVEMGARSGAWRMAWTGGALAPMDEAQMRQLEENLKGLDQQQKMNLDMQKGLHEKLRILGPGAHRMLFFGGRKPILGVELVNTTEELREVLGGRKDAGVLIGKVLPGSAAEKAGLKVGDLILAVDGNDVTEPGELAELIQASEGKTVDLDIVRDKRSMRLKANLPKVADDDEPTGPQARVYRRSVAAPPPAPGAPPAPAVAPPAPPAPPTYPRSLAAMFV